MLLVGSKALQAYLPLDRTIHDIDLWMSDYEYNEFLETYKDYKVKETDYSVVFDIKGDIVEVKPRFKFTANDALIFDTTLWSKNIVKIKYGTARVPDIQTIYDMKKATACCIDEWKHKFDLKALEKHYGKMVEDNTEVFLERLQETQERVEKSKKNKFGFFHKNKLKEQEIATIPEYIDHDYLHEIVADLLDIKMPTYKRIICADTDVSEEQFNALTEHQKMSLMVEETLVLCLERWLIPKMVEKGINYKLIEHFYNNNEASATYLLLKHVNIRGLIGEKEYITGFGRENFHQIEKMFFKAKEQIKRKNGFPMELFNRIFELRERYKAGEKVGLHHEA